MMLCSGMYMCVNNSHSFTLIQSKLYIKQMRETDKWNSCYYDNERNIQALQCAYFDIII